MQGHRIRVRGQVQGVGFRPFVWRLAQRFHLQGAVLNDGEGVLIHALGDVAPFLVALRGEAPPLARIDAVECVDYVFSARPDGFDITASGGALGAQTRVTPDAATCPQCLAEIRGVGGRRMGYGFTNCTHCGPRFSILRALPYDRAQTSMAGFAMCPACADEYGDPGDRRFHAQPIACPDCGPHLWLEAGEITPSAARPPHPGAFGRDPERGAFRGADGQVIAEAAARLNAGEVLAIKGLGGFHLAVDARNEAAIVRLRARKRRPTKPLALMGTLEMIRAHAAPDADEVTRLQDPAAPILLLEKTGVALPQSLAPGQNMLGWTLPYTPLHHLLIDHFGGPLVMTSANLSGEPQVIGNTEARAKLDGFADAYLMHDRDIARRLDDSVERITPQGPMILRRGRGRVPGTMPLPPGFEAAPEIIAYGGELKAAICLIKDGQALLSHHLGDLKAALTWDAFLQAEADYTALFGARPDHAVCDLHPQHRASRHAEGRGLPLMRVQHHHAHLAACLAENGWGLTGGPVAGIILDGLGLGDDGSLWGGDLLLGDYRSYSRVAHLTPVPLIGGDLAGSQPWRNLLAQLDRAGMSDLADDMLGDHPLALLRQAVVGGVNAPLSSSAGRLFDAVAAFIGCAPTRQSFEGEAAMALEALAADGAADGAGYTFGAGDEIAPVPMFRQMAEDKAKGISPADMAWRFHVGLARAFAMRARGLVETGAAQAVALSGGCFQNALLLSQTVAALGDLPVLTHQHMPSNDGSLALGQAHIAAAQLVRK